MVWNGLGLKAGERLGLKESWASVSVWAETCLKWMRKEGTFPGWFSGWVAKRLFSLPKPWEWGRKSARTVGILFLGFHNGCSYRGEWRWFVYVLHGQGPNFLFPFTIGQCIEHLTWVCWSLWPWAGPECTMSNPHIWRHEVQEIVSNPVRFSYLYLYLYIIITNIRNVWLFVDHTSLRHMVT